MFLKTIYIFLIGIFLTVFVGVGIVTFYPEPKYPETPKTIKYEYLNNDKEKISEEAIAEMEKYDAINLEYQKNLKIYNRNVSIIALTASIIIVTISLTIFKNVVVITDGLLLGGVLTLIYSVIRGFGSDDNIFRFVVVSMGLVTSLLLGYIKFIQPQKK